MSDRIRARARAAANQAAGDHQTALEASHAAQTSEAHPSDHTDKIIAQSLEASRQVDHAEFYADACEAFSILASLHLPGSEDHDFWTDRAARAANYTSEAASKAHNLAWRARADAKRL